MFAFCVRVQCLCFEHRIGNDTSLTCDAISWKKNKKTQNKKIEKNKKNKEKEKEYIREKKK